MRDASNRLVGTCLYPMIRGDSAEVLQIAAGSAAAVSTVLRWLFIARGPRGWRASCGRVEPHLVEPVLQANAIVRRGSCRMHASAKAPRILDAIFRGRAFLTAPEGELIWATLEFGEDEGDQPAPLARADPAQARASR